MLRSTLPVRLAVLAFVAVSLTSCSRSPVAPVVEVADTGASIVVDQNPPAPEETPLAPMVDAVKLHPNEAGTLVAGRFRLEIPKNSLRQHATITLVQRDPSAMEVEIHVEPASANDFKVPVHLVADCSDDDLGQLRQETMFWWQAGWREARAVAITPGNKSVHAYTHQLANAKVMEKVRVRRERSDD